jgi:signal transduction histidine kinase
MMRNSVHPDPFIPIAGAESRAESDSLRRLISENRELKASVETARGLAHDLNNLCHMLVGNCELALMNLQSGREAPAARILERVMTGAMRGAENLSRLQRLGSHEDHGAIRERTVFDLSTLAREAVELVDAFLRAKFAHSEVEISLVADLAEGCRVEGRKEELFDLIINLLKNAVEAVPRGGTICVKTALEGETVALEVEDTGIGMSPERLEKIFDRGRSDKDAERRGIGLHNVSGTVSEHGGGIVAESRLGEGTAIVVKLPAMRSRGSEIRATGSSAVRIHSLRGEDRTKRAAN